MYGCTIYIHTCPETFQERKQGGGNHPFISTRDASSLSLQYSTVSFQRSLSPSYCIYSMYICVSSTNDKHRSNRKCGRVFVRVDGYLTLP